MRNTYRIALGGVLSGLALTILLLGSVIPFSTFISPAIAALGVLYFCLEFDKKTAFAVYFVISALALLLSADKELALLFACVLGYYPILKALADRLRGRWLAWLVKYAVFNASVLGLYYLLTHIFIMASVREEFAEYTGWIVAAMLIMANIALFFYDRVLTRFCVFYLAKIKPKLDKTR
jgi:hypothetical protein